MAPPVHVLVVDDDPEMARHVGLIAKMLVGAGWEITPVHTVDAALSTIQAHDPRARRLIVVSDLNLGAGASGIDILRAAREKDPSAGLILMSGEHPSAVAEALSGTKPDAFLEKPFSIDAMQESLRDIASG